MSMQSSKRSTAYRWVNQLRDLGAQKDRHTYMLYCVAWGGGTSITLS